MTMLAEVADAVVGGDTHRDTHALEMIAPSGTTIATLAVGNDDDGFAEVIAWIAEHAPNGPCDGELIYPRRWDDPPGR